MSNQNILTLEEKQRRKRLVARIQEWERMLASETDADVIAIVNGTLKTLRKTLQDGDNMVAKKDC